MKKIFIFLVVLIACTTSVKAASVCSYEDQNKIMQQTTNVKPTYEIVTETVESDIPIDVKRLNVSILNVTEDLYVKVKNDFNNEEKTYSYSDAQDGTIAFRWDNINKVTNFVIEVYSSSKTKCPDELYKTTYFSTPRYNEFSKRAICSELTDFYLCQEFVTFSEISESRFLEQVDNYKKGQIKEDGKPSEEPKSTSFSDKLKKFLGDNKWFIIGGVVIVAGAGVAIYFINKKRKIRNRGL